MRKTVASFKVLVNERGQFIIRDTDMGTVDPNELRKWADAVENNPITNGLSSIETTIINSLPKCTQDKDGYVYWIGAYGTNWVKIGQTRNLLSRIKALRAAARPYLPILIHAIYSKDASAMEKILHDKIAHLCKRNEWFVMEESDVESLKAFALETEVSL